MIAPAELEIRAVVKRFGEESVLRGVSLTVAPGTTTALLGRSGSGKTTLLKIAAGLEPADSGSVLVDGVAQEGVPPEKRGVVYMYQEPLLFPHRDVFGNVAFGLEIRRLARPEIERRTSSMLERLGLAAHARKRPHQLSGGQRQRVCFGRALVVDPKVILLDEPFGSLDPETRTEMQRLFRDLAKTLRFTGLFVTHDLKEALVVGDGFALIERGELSAFATRTAFAADARVGVAGEIDFWTSLNRTKEGDR